MVLGLPIGLVARGFHCVSLLTFLSSTILCICPHPLNLYDLINFIMSFLPYKLYTSSFVLIVRTPFSHWIDPNILRNTFLSNILNFSSLLHSSSKFHSHMLPQVR
jgi:hypothetical protein